MARTTQGRKPPFVDADGRMRMGCCRGALAVLRPEKSDGERDCRGGGGGGGGGPPPPPPAVGGGGPAGGFSGAPAHKNPVAPPPAGAPGGQIPPPAAEPFRKDLYLIRTCCRRNGKAPRKGCFFHGCAAAAGYSAHSWRSAGAAMPSVVARSSMRLMRTSRSGWVEKSWLILLLFCTPASSCICFSRRNE